MKTGLFNNEYFIALEAIEEYCRFRIHERRFPIVKNQGLSVFLQMEEIVKASLFLMDEESFEFKFQESLPQDGKANCIDVFQTLVNNGIIGHALQTTSVSYMEDSLSVVNNNYYLVVPLLKEDGVLGIVLLEISKHPEELNQTFFIICNIHSSVFASTIENVYLQQIQKDSKENIDQMIAHRTVNLVQSKNKLSEKFESLQSNLSMTLPHEFRTPINQILGTVDFLINYSDSVNADEKIEILLDTKESAERLKRLTENYLFYANLSLITTDMVEILNLQKKVTPSILDTIHNKSSMYANKFNRQNDISLILEDAPIAMSEEYFDKIVEELVNNAMKYSPADTAIEIITKAEDNYLHLLIKDNGRGMSKEQINQIDAYVQFERKVYEQQGSGLGLSIVIKLIDLHRGEISFDSKIDEYTVVNLKIPIAEL